MMILASVAMSAVMICNRPMFINVEMDGRKETYRVLDTHNEKPRDLGLPEGAVVLSWKLHWNDETKQFYNDAVAKMNEQGKEIVFIHMGKGACSGA